MADTTVDGLPELSAKFALLAQVASTRTLRAALRAGGLVIRDEAKQKAPVLTGTLRRSIHLRTGSGSGRGVYVRVGTNLEYAPHVEFGTSRQRPQPYLRPAYDEKRGEAVEEIAAVLDRQIRTLA